MYWKNLMCWFSDCTCSVLSWFKHMFIEYDNEIQPKANEIHHQTSLGLINKLSLIICHPSLYLLSVVLAQSQWRHQTSLWLINDVVLNYV